MTASSNGELMDRFNRQTAYHRSPCTWIKALLWTVGIAMAIGLTVIGGTAAQTHRLGQDVTRNSGDVRETKTDIKYIREALARIEQQLHDRGE